MCEPMDGAQEVEEIERLEQEEVLSVDHGSPAVRAAVRQDTPSKLPAQLSIWIFITHESDVYNKVVFRCEKSPPVLRFAMRSIPVASRAKTCVKRRFFARFHLRRNGY